MNQDTIKIDLTGAEALVLFEWLCRVDEASSLPIEHPAEQKVLWLLEATLEKKVNVVFAANYKELLEEARQQVDSNL